MSVDSDKKTGDLSSLVSLPAEEGEIHPVEPSTTGSTEAVEFENLEDLQLAPESSSPLLESPPQEAKAPEDLVFSELGEMPADTSSSESQAHLESNASENLSTSELLTSQPEPFAGQTFETSPDVAPESPSEPAPPATEISNQTSYTSATPVPMDTMDNLKHYSESVEASTEVGAAFPFTLKIDGMLAPEDAEKLLTVLTRENMGFREVDLEPQLASGRILIPRISEYAGILLIQALRGIPAKFYFGPSDEIFSTPETRDEPSTFAAHAASPTQWNSQDDQIAKQMEHMTAENIPVTHADQLPQFPKIEVLDTVFTSGLLSTHSIEAVHSREYEHLIEGLLRELKFKAHRRGASGIVSLNVQLTPLTLPTDYRVTVSGSAVKSIH